jgi:N-carbamoylputrescine amidase
LTSITVALLQISAFGTDQLKNQAKGIQYCRQAAQLGADIALFPEMWNIGYTPYDPDQPSTCQPWLDLAIDRQSEFVTTFQTLAAQLDMAIALTYLESRSGLLHNVVSLIDRHGDILFTYAKVHTCDFDPMEAVIDSGDEFYVSTLDTANGEVEVGAMICFDREFPESARLLMLKGAELILTPNACELEINRLSQYRARSFENMVALAMANYPHPQFNGNSIAFDGIAFDQDGSRDMLVEQGEDQEDILLAEFDLGQLRDYRQHEVWGNAFRRPAKYQALLSQEINPPFIRPSAKR